VGSMRALLFAHEREWRGTVVAVRGVCKQAGAPLCTGVVRGKHLDRFTGSSALSDAHWAVAPRRWRQQGQGSALEGASVGWGLVGDLTGTQSRELMSFLPLRVRARPAIPRSTHRRDVQCTTMDAFDDIVIRWRSTARVTWGKGGHTLGGSQTHAQMPASARRGNCDRDGAWRSDGSHRPRAGMIPVG
jgi:hypothetical protein